MCAQPVIMQASVHQFTTILFQKLQQVWPKERIGQHLCNFSANNSHTGTHTGYLNTCKCINWIPGPQQHTTKKQYRGMYRDHIGDTHKLFDKPDTFVTSHGGMHYHSQTLSEPTHKIQKQQLIVKCSVGHSSLTSDGLPTLKIQSLDQDHATDNLASNSPYRRRTRAHTLPSVRTSSR